MVPKDEDLNQTESLSHDRHPAGYPLVKSIRPLKKVAFMSIMVLTPFAFMLLTFMGYYAYHKIFRDRTAIRSMQAGSQTLECGPFGKIDATLGWGLASNAASCIGKMNRETQSPYFTASIFTDGAGFRVGQPHENTPRGGIVAIGDSWTFGYGVSFEESYPFHLARLLAQPVANLGVPAYGSAQVLLLLERHVGDLAPRAVVFFNRGLWQRSICHGSTRPVDILKPCYWWDEGKQQLELITPPSGYVHEQAMKGVFPGGYVTSGNSSWGYFLVSRPVLKFKQALTRAGVLSGQATEDDGDPFMKSKLTDFEIDRYLRLAQKHKFLFVLIDPRDDYAPAVARLGPGLAESMRYLGAREWAEEVDAQARMFPEDKLYVPQDGHYGDAMNRLIAMAVARRLDSLVSSDRRRMGLRKDRRSVQR